MTSSYVKIPKHGQMCMFWTLIYLFILFAGFSYVMKRIRHSLTVAIKIYVTRPEKLNKAHQSLA